MLPRRSLLRSAGAVAVGGLASAAAAGSASARPPGGWYDAGSASGASTSAVLSVSRPALEVARVQERIAPVAADLERRLRSVSIADVDAVTGSVCVDRRGRPEGCAVATGAFDAGAIGTEVRDRDGTAVGSRRGFERFAGGDPNGAVAVSDSTVLVGYGPDAGRALAHVDGALEARAGSGPTADARAAFRRIVPLLSGDVVAAADLGPTARTRLRRTLSGASEPLGGLVSGASALGVGATVRRDRTALRYALAVDPDRVGLDAVRAFVGGLDAPDGALRNASVRRRGRTVVVDADVDTDALVEGHLAAVGAAPGALERPSFSSSR